MEKKSYWIWHYADYEIYHIMQLNCRREERGYGRPAFWKLHTPYTNVKFIKTFESNGGYLKAHFNGTGYIAVNGKRFNENVRIDIPAGKVEVLVLVQNLSGFPAIFIESDVCPSDGSWQCNCFAGEFTPVGWNEYFDGVEKNPEVFPFSYENKSPVKKTKVNNGFLYDFGTELFGYLNISGANKGEEIGVFYGESEEEALDPAHAHTTDLVFGSEAYRLRQRALRYVYLETLNENIVLSVDHEYLSVEKRGRFTCDRELFNDIYDVASYTFHLNCREGFLDGLKRDRWVWAGDAYQEAKVNTYLFQDKEIEQRTAIGIVGRKPVIQHLNTILDYSLLWIIGIYDHYKIYGDIGFLRRIYEMVLEMLAFCETRINQDGFMEGFAEDWTFIDWAGIDKTGAISAVQMLLIAAYRSVGNIAEALGLESKVYYEKCENLTIAVNSYYWNDELGAYIDSYQSGKNKVNRHANIFAVMYDIATTEQQEKILQNVLNNDDIPQIKTPYFKGYELDVMAKLGDFEKIEKFLDSYWGGMIRMGAKTIWEQYDETQTGIERFAMYDDKYDKSLCHGWGAGPVYIFGRYYLGVYPTGAGFKTFNVEPNLGGLNEINGVVPVGDGSVEISLNRKKLTVKATKAGGTLIWNGAKHTITPNIELVLEN